MCAGRGSPIPARSQGGAVYPCEVSRGTGAGVPAEGEGVSSFGSPGLIGALSLGAFFEAGFLGDRLARRCFCSV